MIHKPWSLSLHTCETIADIEDGDDWTLYGADGEKLLFEDANPSATAKAFDLMCREIADLRARCEAAEKDAEELTDLAYRLATGLIRARQNLFPNIDQAEVIHRDFPRVAAIAKEKQC